MSNQLKSPALKRSWIKRTLRITAVLAALLLAVVGVGWFVYPPLLVVPLKQVAYWRQGIASRSIQVDGHRWPYLECGEPNAPPIVLLHGFGTSKDAMMLMMPRIAREGHRVIAPDLPGFGEHAYHEGKAHDAAFYVGQIGKFMDAVGVQKSIVIGTSMGGALAGELALRQPERVLALGLLSPAGVQAPVRNEFMQAIDRGELPLDIASGEDFDRVINLVFARPPFVPLPVRTWMVDRAVANRAGILQIVEAMRPCLTSGLEGRMGAIHVPTLILYGTADAVTDPSMADIFRREMPSARVVLVPDAGHVAFHDNWPEVWRALQPLVANN